jgi:uncharacterized protein with PQ loop repeat
MGLNCVLVSTVSFGPLCPLTICALIRIIVYSPQILENYRLKSGEGLSVGFVVIWLVGDICGLFGGWLAGLLPTVIILAAYVSTTRFLELSKT